MYIRQNRMLFRLCLSEFKQNAFHRHDTYIPISRTIVFVKQMRSVVIRVKASAKKSQAHFNICQFVGTIMFTPSNFKTLALATNLAWYSGVVPYHFIKSKITHDLELVCEPSRKRKLFVVSAFFINTFYMLFIFFRIFQKLVLSDDKVSIEFLVKMGYIFSAYLLPVVLQINTLKHWKETSQFIVQYIRFYKKVQG